MAARRSTASTVRLPARFVVGSGPTYALVAGGRGWVFSAWSELEAWREQFSLDPAEVLVRKCASPEEAEAFLRESGLSSYDRWHVEGGGVGGAAEIAPEGAAPDSPRCRVSLTPSEMAARVAAEPGVALGIPGARENYLPSGRVALQRALGTSLPEHAELRVPGGARDFPSFGFTLTLPGNVVYAEARNLILRSAMQGARSTRGKLAAIFLEALNSDLGKIAVAVRVPTMDLYNTLRRHVPGWRARGGLNAKRKPVDDFELLDALEALIAQRGLALRVAEDAVARVEQAREAAGGGAAAAT